MAPPGTDSAAGGADGGARFESIGKALVEARPGDKILITPGTYHEGLPGESAALPVTVSRVTIQAAGGGRVVVKPRTTDYRYGLIVGADEVRVIGLELHGFVGAGVLLGDGQGQRNVVLRDMRIELPDDGQWYHGIVCTADNGGVRPVSEGVRIQNVTIRNATMGVSCNSGPCNSWRLHRVRIEGRGGSSSGADALAIERGDNFLFSEVVVTGSTADGMDVKGTRVTIYDSVVSGVKRNGIKLWHDGDIVNTLVHHTGADAAIVLAGAGQGKATLRLLHTLVGYHNFQGPRSYHMTVGYPDNPVEVKIINSVFYRTSDSAYFSPGSRLSIRGSLWAEMEGGTALVVHGKTRWSRSSIRLGDPPEVFDRLGIGHDNLPPGTDPGFEYWKEEDYRLRKGSSLIDAGVTDIEDYPPFDAKGEQRVRGAAPDPGPLEMDL